MALAVMTHGPGRLSVDRLMNCAFWRRKPLTTPGA
jgi:hypothetical protein